MIAVEDLMIIAKERLTDAEALLDARRYEAAFYLCGYTVEVALKCRICKTLNWTGFPSSNKEFENLKSLKTHKLDVLLSFTGVENVLTEKYFSEWSDVLNWNPEARYTSADIIDPPKATLMINAAKTLIEIL